MKLKQSKRVDAQLTYPKPCNSEHK